MREPSPQAVLVEGVPAHESAREGCGEGVPCPLRPAAQRATPARRHVPPLHISWDAHLLADGAERLERLAPSLEHQLGDDAAHGQLGRPLVRLLAARLGGGGPSPSPPPRRPEAASPRLYAVPDSVTTREWDSSSCSRETALVLINY